MNLWSLLLFALLQSPADTAASQTEPREKPDSFQTQIVPLPEIKRRVADGEYAPVPRELLQELSSHSQVPDTPAKAARSSQIREARYEATLDGTKLQAGRLDLQMYAAAVKDYSGPLLIGTTSLQHLKLMDDHGPVAVGSDSARRLFVLRPGVPESLSGSWAADGLVAGNVVTFRLELPQATITRFQLSTPPQIQVTSAGNLVLGPEVTDSGLRWNLIPSDASRLSFSCRTEPNLSTLGSLPLSGFSASHTMTGDSLASRWTIGLPPAINEKAVLLARVPANVRITDVLIEDRQPVEWTVTDDASYQLLKMTVSVTSPGISLQVSGVSLLPQSETWNLPMLSPTQWQSEDAAHRGQILVPVSQMTVLLPPSVQLDEWTFVGIQERDVVIRPDESREYQLIQFLPEASAVVRTSTSQPRISDSVVTIVEPAGRMATVRCLVNVQCEGAPVVELKWPVAAGWQVIAARYASNMRALFFEFPDAGPDAASAPLTLHLPESLEPGASRVFEIQLQQVDSLDPLSLKLPLMTSPGTVRTQSYVLFSPELPMKSDTQRQWSAGRRTLTPDEVRKQSPWLPEQRIVAGMQAVEVSESATLSVQELPAPESIEVQAIELEHTIRIVDGLIVENSRLVLPSNALSDKPVSVTLPSGIGSDLRWSVDGEPIAVRREEMSEETREWRQWTLPPVSSRPGMPLVIRMESRRVASPEFIAAVPVVQTSLAVEGSLQLFSSDEGLLSVPQLTQQSTNAASQSTVYRLPPAAVPVSVRVDQNPWIQAGQTIEVHMLHLIGEQSGGLQRDVLAVANVSRSPGKNVLPLTLPGNTRPLVLVNGHQVQLQETPSGFAIPLPRSSADCQVLLTWTEPGQQRDRVIGVRQLPRLFLSELAVPQCTHHILVDPSLELHAPVSVFHAAEPTEIARVLDRLLTSASMDGRTTQISETSSIPAEVRQFVIRWQLAATQGWKPQTLIDSVTAEKPVEIQVTQLRRQRAIVAGTFLILVAACIGLRHVADAHRLASASLAVAILLASFVVDSQVTQSSLMGAFWGLSVGLLFVVISRWKWLRALRANPLLRPVAAPVIWLLIAIPAQATPQTGTPVSSGVQASAGNLTANADVLIPEERLFGTDVVYVRRSLLDAWRKENSSPKLLTPSAVITSLSSRIVAESVDSIELQITLNVACASSDDSVSFRIPLRGSRLVECLVDGVSVLAEPDSPDSIKVQLPASTLLPAHQIEDNQLLLPDPPTDIPVSADASSRATFTLHKVECKLRPLMSRQTSGVQFRLPGLPCPETTVEVVSPAGLFSSARAQTPEGVVEWKPSDGVIALNSLAMADGIDVRLFQAGIEKGSPQLAAVQVLAINETVSGQQVLTCICRFSRWNTLTPEVRYRIPQGYRLASVSATTGADVVTDLLWSVKDQNAHVQLPAGIGNEFALSIQLVGLTPATVQNQQVPVAELQQFADCIAAPNLLLAVRANSVFSVLPLDAGQVSTIVFSDLQAVWGHWLKRSDIIFQVPNSNPFCTIRLSPRNSVNEVRISLENNLREDGIYWKCQVDIETTVLPVFRHRLKINPEMTITDVRVVAGEANRLDSWHRRGDQLVVQLKEGTTGLHKITIEGRQVLRPDDSTITLHSPHLQNTEIPETSMTLVDEDGLGLTFLKLGGAKPDEKIEPNDLLPPRKSIRMQIINEEDPVVLQRIRPVDPVGTVAAVRSADQVTFVLHLSQWSGSLGPLHMNFSGNDEFLLEPVIVVDSLRIPLVREGQEFSAEQNSVKSLFDRPEFSVIWTLRLQEADIDEGYATFNWPHIFDGIQWTDPLLIPLDAALGSPELENATSDLPKWLKAAGLSATEDAALQKANVIRLPESSINGENFRVPVRSVSDRLAAEIGRDIFAVSDSVVWTTHEQSAVGETRLILFSARVPSKCSIKIPAGIVVTELQSEEATRWKDASRDNVIIELNAPVTTVRTRWLSHLANEKMTSSELRLQPPFPTDCTTYRTLTVLSETGQMPAFSEANPPLSAPDLSAAQRANIKLGLSHLDSSTTTGSTDEQDGLPSDESLLQLLTDSRDEFLQGYLAAGRSPRMSASCRSSDTGVIVASIGRRAEPLTIVSLVTATIIVLFAAFTRMIGPHNEVASAEAVESVTRPAASAQLQERIPQTASATELQISSEKSANPSASLPASSVNRAIAASSPSNHPPSNHPPSKSS